MDQREVADYGQNNGSVVTTIVVPQAKVIKTIVIHSYSSMERATLENFVRGFKTMKRVR